LQLNLNRYKLKITRLYAYKTYQGLLCGLIDSKINNAEETEAKEALIKFNTYECNTLYLQPRRTQKQISSFVNPEMQTIIKEDFIDGFYDATNYPEEEIAEYWIMLELEYDQPVKDMDHCFSSLIVACNLNDCQLETIEKYLCDKLSFSVWENEAKDYTP